MNSEQITIVINRKLHLRVKIAAINRGFKLREFVEYIIEKGLNSLPRKKQP